ncbi:hypothetical protein PR048_028125 [Dryococelus australis]|uniref:Uncharacterized protein n=1 Tax=Dryococelus australis TaxID=614101 RepID=A0ABQ9GIC9_9NEOP|nr:hypothetical protein PR048_028125 [Dryococelus australis]
MKTLLLWSVVVVAVSAPLGADAFLGIRLTDILLPRGRGRTTTTTTAAPPVPAETVTPADISGSTTTQPRRIIDIPPAAKCPAGQRWAGGQCRVSIGRR